MAFLVRPLIALTLLAAVSGLADDAAAATGDISTIAGSGVDGDSGDGGLATSAAIRDPLNVVVAPNGDRYIVDYGSHRIRKVTAAGVISTFAGSGIAGFSGDGGAATSARLNAPGDVAIDSAGNVYIADSANARIRKVTPAGVISTYAGSISGYSGDGGQAALARFTSPFGLDFDENGNLYVADFNQTVRRITPAGVVSTVAGIYNTAGSSGDGGAATSARLNGPADVATDSSGNLYIAEYSGHRVRKVNSSGTISRFAGTGTAGTTGNGGLAAFAQINGPWGIAADSAGNVFISEITGHVVRKVNSFGMISTIAGTGTAGFLGDGGPATSARLNGPGGFDVGPTGDGFAADYTNHRLRKIQAIAPPGAPSVTGTSPASPANANTVQVIGTAASGSTVTLYSNSSCTTSVASGTAADFGSTGITVGVADDSTTTFYATASNAAGASPCSSTSVTYVEDSIAPAGPVVFSPPASPGSGRAPSWSFTTDVAATTECRLDRGATTISNWATCTSPRSYDLTGQADGTYTLSLRARDAAGNTSNVTTSSYVLDTSAPVAPTIGTAPATPGNTRAPSWSFSGEAGATFECQLVRGATTISDWGTCSTPRAYDLTGQADGAYTFSVRAKDAAGNTGAAAPSNYVLDTAAPSAPSITSAPATPGSGDSPSWSFTGDAGASFQCKLERGATVVSDWSACSGSRSYPLAGEPDGAYTFSVRSRDAAGNTGDPTASGYTVDRAAPSVPVIGIRPATPANDPTPEWTFSGDGDATFECRIERPGTVVSDWGSCTSPAGYNLLSQADATYTFSVRGKDAAGNRSIAATDAFVLDRAAPGAPSITANPGALGSDTTPTWAFSSESGATFECRLEHTGGATVSDWGACASPKTYDVTSEGEDDYTFRVRATDTAGNTGIEATHAYTLDSSLPSAPDILTSPGSPSTGRNPQWTFEGQVGETFECRLERDGVLVSDWTGGCASPRAYSLTGLDDGTYKFMVRAKDGLNRLGAPATSNYVLDTTKPGLPSFDAGPVSPGNDDTPSWSFSSEPGADFTCRVVRGATEVIASAACTSGQSFSLVSPIPDGDYKLELVATDDAGNSSDPALSATYTLDRAAPLQPDIDTAPTTPGSQRNPTWTFTGEGGATFQCKLERGATLISDWSTCSASRSYNLDTLPDGAYGFSVRARDAAGNTGSPRTSTYTLDTTAPAAPSITSEPASPANQRAISWSFTGDGGASFECRLERAGTAVQDWTSCGTTKNYDLTGRPDGTYTFLVRATDAALNTGATAPSSYVLDTTAPSDPVLDAEPASPSSDADVAWAFSGDSDTAGLECRLRRGATVVSGWATCTSPRSFALGGEVDGDYTFEVLARDAIGNASGATSDVYTLDRTAPVAPSIDSAPATPSANPGPSWSFSGESGADLECRLTRSGAVVFDWTACSGSRSYDLTSEPDGNYRFFVRARDAAGNTGPAANTTYALDRSTPALPTIDSAPGVTGTGRAPSWSFSADATSTLECRLERGATTVSDWATCTSPRSYDLTGAPDGAYTFKVRARNPLGTVSAAQTDVYTLDTAAPAAPSITANPGALGSGRSPSWSFTGEGGATLDCRLERSGTAVYDWATCSSPQTFDLAGRSDGSYVFKVRARDAAGNTGTAATHTYELDTTGPDAPTLTAAPGSPGSSRAPAWSWSGASGATFACRIDRGSDPISGWAPCASAQPQDLSGQPDGTYTLSVRAVDAAGNSGGAMTSAYELDTTPGAVTILGGPAPIERDRHPAWSFSAETGAAVTCRLVFGSDVVADWAACGSPHSFDLTGRPDGDYAFFVRAADRAGNSSPAANWPFRLDTVAPAKPTVEVRPPQRDRDRTPEWSFSTEAGASFECRVEHGSDLLYDWRPCTVPLKVDLRDQEDGAYVLSARALDAAGNAGEPVQTSYRLDTTDPDAPEITTKPGRSGDDRKPKWGWKGESSATFDCRLRRGSDSIKDWKACTTPQAYDLGDEKLGTYTFSVRATDVAGNTGSAASDDYELKAAASSSGGGSGGGGSGDGGSGSGGGSGDPAPAAAAPGAAPGAAPATPGAAPPAAKPSADDDPLTNHDDDKSGDGSDAGTKGEGAAGKAGPGSGKPGAAGAAAGKPGAAGGPGAGGGDGDEGGKKKHKPNKNFAEDPLGAAAESVTKVAAAIAEEPEKTAFPMGLIFVIAGFMGLQGRIDRNDPKLALAPVFADPDLEFRPPGDALAAVED